MASSGQNSTLLRAGGWRCGSINYREPSTSSTAGLSDHIRYEHAAEGMHRAEETLDSESKFDFLEMERRWLLLARSYHFAERLGDFMNGFQLAQTVRLNVNRAEDCEP